VLVIWLLVVGAHSYLHPSSIFSEGPSWQREIAFWQADPSHVIQLWPGGWTMTLDTLHRAPRG
jgi:hypothetical protein